MSIFDPVLSPDATTSAHSVLEELRDVVEEAIAALADGKVTLAEVVSLGVEIAQFGGALVALFSPNLERRAERKAARLARKAARTG